jgi:hypothetical protein
LNFANQPLLIAMIFGGHAAQCDSSAELALRPLKTLRFSHPLEISFFPL